MANESARQPGPGDRVSSHPPYFPDYRTGVALKYVKRGYTVLCRHALTLLVVVFGASFLLELLNMYHQGEITRLWSVATQTDLTFSLVSVTGSFAACAVALLVYLMLLTRPVYLVDFAVARPADELKVPYSIFMGHSEAHGAFNEQSLEFQRKILVRSGLGEETYLPHGVHQQPPVINMESARQEFKDLLFPAIREAMSRAKITPNQVGILVVNCSLFNPTPSLTAMVINEFKMHSNVISYNLCGMGCSAGIIAVDLARQMLQLYSNTYALVVSTENITQNWYFGNDRSMLVSNCIFRAGGAAIVLSNRRRDRWRAKYELKHVVRTHLGQNDKAYNCVFQCEDADGRVGVRLAKELMAIAGEALKANITTLGPLILPISEQLIFFVNLIMRRGMGMKLKPYIPDFKLAFERIVIHTGGRAVLDEIEKQLKLTPAMVEPSRMSLYRYGNVSSASIWYVLAYMESMGAGIKRGERVWQLGFGSGFKCNSAVWKATRNIKDVHHAWHDFNVEKARIAAQ